jgi:hypothetical protein
LSFQRKFTQRLFTNPLHGRTNINSTDSFPAPVQANGTNEMQAFERSTRFPTQYIFRNDPDFYAFCSDSYKEKHEMGHQLTDISTLY